MGKLLGLIFGSIVLGPFGALLGFLAGFAYDTFSKFENMNFSFSFNNDNIDRLYEEAFPVLAAYLSRAGGVDKRSVLVVKQKILELFGVDKARKILKAYKMFNEEGVAAAVLRDTCDTLVFNLSAAERVNFFLVLVKMFKEMKTADPVNVQFLSNLAKMLNISLEQFGNFGSSYQYRHNYNSGGHDYYRTQQNFNRVNPYLVFELNRDATTEQIKKKYRQLSKKYHPDITQNLPEAEREEAQKKMRELNSAYEQLKKERSFK